MTVLATTLEYLHACPICGSTHIDHYCRVPSLFEPDEFIRYERCRNCGVVFRNPRLPEALRLQRYREKPREATDLALDPKSQVHYAYMLKRIGRHLPVEAERRLLDFGCGAGGFLVEAREAGFEATGLELGVDLSRHVRENLGFRVHAGQVTDPEFESERFPVILSSQVFEHLLDPLGALQALKRHLCGPALLLIEVPNLLDTRERVRRGSTMDDSHLFYFSRRSLSWMVEHAGFTVLEVEEGVRPWRFLGRGALEHVPDTWLHFAERALSAAQLRTGLSLVARLDADPLA